MEKELALNMPKLGFGFMRLPKLEDGSLDYEQCCEMTDIFLENGFRYFDTAYMYGDGASEKMLRRALVERHPRDSYYIASKLPAWYNPTDAEEAKQRFYVSMERLGIDYFDFYLFHNLGEQRTKLFDDFGLWDFLAERKAEGKIRHLGFSFHDKASVLEEIIKAHPEMEFVQLQINYADWENPEIESRKCYEVARKYGLPVIIMEPVKGGILANPPEEAGKVLRALDPNASLPSWALRFCASLEGVMVVLSGMSSTEQMQDNVSFMKDFRPLDARELEAVHRAREIITSQTSIPCTSCWYCAKGCPAGIPIPNLFMSANIYHRFGDLAKAKSKYNFNTGGLGLPRASDCLGCGMCETVCPQHINVREELGKVADLLEK